MTNQPKIKIFKENQNDIHNSVSYKQSAEDRTLVSKIRQTLKTVPTGLALIKWADEKNLKVVIDHQMSPGIIGSYSHRTILLSGQVSTDLLVGFAAHELRHAWQDAQGFLPQILPYSKNLPLSSPDDFIIKTALIEADAIAIQIQVLAELYLKDNNSPYWSAFRAQTDLYEHALDSYRDVTLHGESVIHDKSAMIAAFNGWFKSLSRIQYTQLCLDKYITMVENHFEQNDVRSAPDNQTKKSPKPHEMNIGKPNSMGLNYTNKNDLLSLFKTIEGQCYLTSLPHDYLKNDIFKVYIEFDTDDFGIIEFHETYKQACDLARRFKKQSLSAPQKTALPPPPKH